MLWNPLPRDPVTGAVLCLIAAPDASERVVTVATPTITAGYSRARVSYLLHAGRVILAARPWIAVDDTLARQQAVAELKQEGEAWYAEQRAGQPER